MRLGFGAIVIGLVEARKPSEFALVRAGHDDQATIAGVHIGQLEEADNVIAVDPAVGDVVARPLWPKFFAGAVQGAEPKVVPGVDAQTAGDETEFVSGQLFDNGPDGGVEGERFENLVKSKAVGVAAAVGSNSSGGVSI